MSKFINSFALLDDSDDESPRAAAPPAAKKKESAKTSSSNSNAVKGTKGNDRRRNNDRNTRGGRGPRTARDGKRTYDRRSGTGRGREIKKGGGGGHNWGNDKNEARKNEGPVDENAPVEVATDAVEEEVEKVPDPEPEPEDNTMTMEDYLAAKSGKAAGDDLFGAKKERSVDEAAGEFAGKEAHVAVQEDFVVMGSGKSLRKKNEKKAAQTLDLNFRVKSASDPRPRRDDRNGDRRGGRGGRGDRRGGRGGRGGGRGGRGKAGGRGLKVDDVNAFPSL